MKSKYKGVSLVKKNGIPYYQISSMIEGKRVSQIFKSEREAALSIDRGLISRGKEPVNILRRKVADDK
jgi:hypothetical protein